MNSLLHREDNEDLEERQSNGGDREIHLGATVILGIFFALAVLCAGFFGLGYSMGRKSTPTSAAAVSGAVGNNAFASFKPAAGSLLSNGKSEQGATQSVIVPAVPADAQPVKAVKVARDENPADGAVVGDTLPPPPVSVAVKPAAAPPVPTPVPAVTAGGGSIVQVAAVSHQEDADLLVTTLKRRGYAVAIRSEAQDKLLHVQVGPFATHKEADAMRQKLLADGFNAIVKDTK